jgi:hypothetical protein
MVVWVSTDSNYVKHGITSWIPKRKRNGQKKGHVTNATLWCELDSAIARQARVEFTWVKAYSGILLNECADQLATRAAMASSCGPELVVSPEDIESEEKSVMWEDWRDPKRPPTSGIPVVSVRLAAEEQREHQEELFRQFKPS